MNRVRRLVGILLLGLLVSTTTPVEAQCPMCRMSAESNLKEGGSAGKGLNKGILFLLSMPYVMVGTIGYIWYRNRRREEEVDFDSF